MVDAGSSFALKTATKLLQIAYKILSSLNASLKPYDVPFSHNIRHRQADTAGQATDK